MSENVKLSLFNALPYLDNAFLLASHFPIGRLWGSAFNAQTNFGKLVLGLAVEYYRLGLLTEEVSIETDIDNATELLAEWEESVGIPNACFSDMGSIAEKRRNVKLLFTNFGGVQTKDDLVRVAAIFGYTIEITTGIDVGGFPLLFPITNFGTSKAAKFTVIVNTALGSEDEFFPLGFPLPFSVGGTTLLRCIFELLLPANVQVIFINR